MVLLKDWSDEKFFELLMFIKKNKFVRKNIDSFTVKNLIEELDRRDYLKPDNKGAIAVRSSSDLLGMRANLLLLKRKSKPIFLLTMSEIISMFEEYKSKPIKAKKTGRERKYTDNASERAKFIISEKTTPIDLEEENEDEDFNKSLEIARKTVTEMVKCNELTPMKIFLEGKTKPEKNLILSQITKKFPKKLIIVSNDEDVIYLNRAWVRGR